MQKCRHGIFDVHYCAGCLRELLWELRGTLNSAEKCECRTCGDVEAILLLIDHLVGRPS